MSKDFSVYVVNPKHGKKKSTRKKASRRKKTTKPRAKRQNKSGETNMAAKKKTTRRKPAAKRRAPATRAPAKRRRRRNPAPAKRRRRKNPNGIGLGLGSVFAEMKNAIPRLAGTLATAWAVTQFGKQGGLFGTPHTSPMMGTSWGWGQYAVAGAVAMWGPKLLGKFVNAKEFQRGCVDLIVQKLVWTEGIARSEWAVNAFGNDIGLDPSSGQMYMDQGGGNYAAMQGYHGLVEASPLDGLVEASPLDGTVSGYGHLLPAGVSAQTAAAGRNSGSGYVSNYHAAFSR